MKTAIEQFRSPIVVGTVLAVALGLAIVHATHNDRLSLFAEYARLTDYLTELPCRVVTDIVSMPRRMDPTWSECNQP